MLRLLLATPGVSANAASNTGDVPLLFAAMRGHLGAVALLAKVQEQRQHLATARCNWQQQHVTHPRKDPGTGMGSADDLVHHHTNPSSHR